MTCLNMIWFKFQLNNQQIKQGKLKANISVANTRLFVGNIPKSKSKDEIMDEFANKTGNLSCLST